MTAINEQKTLELKLGVKGHFKLIKGDGETGEEVVVADFDNLITNQGLDYIMTSQRWVQDGMCKVGTGSATPAITDTQLQTGFARKAWDSYTYETDSDILTKTITCTCLFPVGTFNSTVISEIGSGKNAADYLIGSRALILDDFGAPTTITLLSTEYLRVYYSLVLQMPTSDITGSFTLGSLGTINYTARVGRWVHTNTASYAWTGRILLGYEYDYIRSIYGSDAVLGTTTGYPSSSSSIVLSTSSSTITPQAYVNGNFYQDLWTTFNTSHLNNTPNTTIGALGISIGAITGTTEAFQNTYGGFQILLDPYITKLYTLNELYSSITLKMRISIARV